MIIRQASGEACHFSTDMGRGSNLKPGQPELHQTEKCRSTSTQLMFATSTGHDHNHLLQHQGQRYSTSLPQYNVHQQSTTTTETKINYFISLHNLKTNKQKTPKTQQKNKNKTPRKHTFSYPKLFVLVLL